MDQSLKEKVQLIRKNRSIHFVNFFNDGSITKDEYSVTENMYLRFASIPVEYMSELMCYAAQIYSHKNDFDSIDMDLLLGLIYEVEDVDKNGQIKEGAKPLDNVVRYYTGDMRGYLDNKKTNELKMKDNYKNRQGFVKYNEFISLLEKNGMNYNGPKSFKEFKEAILSGEKFNINITLDLKEKTDDKKLIKRR